VPFRQQFHEVRCVHFRERVERRAWPTEGLGFVPKFKEEAESAAHGMIMRLEERPTIGVERVVVATGTVFGQRKVDSPLQRDDLLLGDLPRAEGRFGDHLIALAIR
jgi:hypothetical protein